MSFRKHESKMILTSGTVIELSATLVARIIYGFNVLDRVRRKRVETDCERSAAMHYTLREPFGGRRIAKHCSSIVTVEWSLIS
jgi:hypothetical protein